MTTAEAPDAFQRDMVRNNEQVFGSTLDTIAKHSADILLMNGADESDPTVARTDFLFVLKEGSYTPSSLQEMQLALGMDSSATAIITAEGSAVIVQANVSPGRVIEILTGNITDEKLQAALADLEQESTEHARKVSVDSLTDVTATIRASVGKTYGGEQTGA